MSVPRRDFFRSSGMGFGSVALAGLLAREGRPAPLPTHFPGRASRVIHVFLNGGMSQVDTFDPKPELTKRGGQMLPFDNLRTERRTGVALPSPFAFRRHGESGLPISELFPHLSRHADELAVIRSMHAELPSHEMSLMLMNTGHMRQVRPSFGAWLTWGMGQENDNLPGFVALVPGGMPVAGAGNWQSGFLPGGFQGTRIDTSKTDPAELVENIRNTRTPPERQRPSSSCSSGSTPGTWRNGRGRRPSRPGSGPSSWPTGCSWRPSTPSTSARSRRTSSGPTVRGRRTGSCSSRGGWWSGASASSRCGTATCSPGTATRTSARSTPAWPPNATRASAP